MRIILLGAPGSGKGTQAQFIIKKYGIPQISTGGILRSLVEENSRVGKQCKSLIDTGKLITDELVISLVKERIKQNDCRTGFLLDGFPRTKPQADAMKEEGITVDYVLQLSIPDSLVIDRIVGRRVHPSSGRVYHIKFSPPKQKDRDDVTGEPLITRKDDRKDTIYKRLLEYHQKTASLIDFYYKEAETGNTKCFTLDGTRNIDEVSAELSTILD